MKANEKDMMPRDGVTTYGHVEAHGRVSSSAEGTLNEIPLRYPSGDVNRVVASSNLELKRPELEIRNGITSVDCIYSHNTG